MLHQNNGGMQKPGRGRWLGNSEQVTRRAQQPKKGVAEKGPHGFFAVGRTDVAAMSGAADAVGGQNHRRQILEHSSNRNHVRDGPLGLALRDVE